MKLFISARGAFRAVVLSVGLINLITLILCIPIYKFDDFSYEILVIRCCHRNYDKRRVHTAKVIASVTLQTSD